MGNEEGPKRLVVYQRKCFYETNAVARNACEFGEAAQLPGAASPRVAAQSVTEERTSLIVSFEKSDKRNSTADQRPPVQLKGFNNFSFCICSYVHRVRGGWTFCISV